MTDQAYVELSEFMVARAGTVTPSDFPDEEFDLYSIPAYDRGTSELTIGRAIGSAKQVVQPGDVLLSKIVPHIRRAWVVGPGRGRRIIASGEWIVFRSEQFDARYFSHLLVSDLFHTKFMSTVAGVGGSLLRARPAFVGKILIPLPELPEQRRIAEILDRADALRSTRRQTLRNLDELIRAVFVDTFDLADMSARRPLRTVVQEFRYGTSNKSQEMGLPALRIPNVIRGSVDVTDLKTVPVTDAEFERLALRDGDVLFVRTNGNPDNVGRCAVFETSVIEHAGYDARKFIYASYLIRARLDTHKVNPIALCEFMLGAEGRRQLREKCKTSAGQYNINIEGLGALSIPDFPLDDQDKFADRVKRIREQIRVNALALTHLDSLFASLQSHAFAGEL